MSRWSFTKNHPFNITVSVTGVPKLSKVCLVGRLGYPHNIGPTVITVQTTATIVQRNTSTTHAAKISNPKDWRQPSPDSKSTD